MLGLSQVGILESNLLTQRLINHGYYHVKNTRIVATCVDTYFIKISIGNFLELAILDGSMHII